MQKLLFLSRLAFICNGVFVLAIIVQQTDWITHPGLSSFIGTLGYFMALLINPVTNLLYVFLFLLKKHFWKVVPLWLITANIIFLLLQVVYIFYTNDTLHS